jgi:homoserine kinase
MVSVEMGEGSRVSIKSISGDGGLLPSDPFRNICSVAIQAMLDELGAREDLEISIEKGLSLGSGLGSSAASTVVALVAANEVIKTPFGRKELLKFAIEAELVACGAAHADNVAPALLGGIVLVREYEPLDVISLPAPDSLFVTIVHPHFELRTQDARMMLRKKNND